MRKRRSLAHQALIPLLIPSLLLASCQTVAPVQEVTTHQQSGTADTDCDGIADNIEVTYGLDPEDPDDAELDPDGDDVPSVDEVRLDSDPTDPDSDGDGVRDDIDLQVGTDLDGDGILAPLDNCPLDPNKTQADRDGDAIGDACDGDLPSVRIAEAFARLDSDYALLPLAGGTTSRVTSDRAELLPMPSTFRVFATPTPTPVATATPINPTPIATSKTRSGPTTSAIIIQPRSLPLFELYHPQVKDHAYVNNASERKAYVAKGYRDLGVLGYLTPKPFPGALLLRRFAKGAQEAVTVDATTASSLVAAGFVEKTALGYAFSDAGHLRRPRPIVRYQRGSIFRHQPTPLATTGYASNGPRFKVLPEKVSGALALYRLRNSVLQERLSTNASEVASYVAQGYAKDGVLGWILANPAQMPTQPAVELWRLERAGLHRYSADADEIAKLIADGWSRTKRLGYAFPGTERAASCAGPTAVDRLETKLRDLATDPEGRAQATLTAIVASCALERVLAGKTPGNNLEKTIADRLPADSEARRRLRSSVERWHGVDPQLRAESLGRYAALDPGACNTAVDLDELRDSVHDIFFAYSGPPPSLREPFCDGTLYAPTDPAAGTPAEARAVTVAARPSGEFGDSRGARPRLDGVLATEFVRGHSAAQAFATSNPEIGYTTTGVATGIPCSPTMPCVASQGLRCESNQCFAYPIVRNQQIHTFTGANFWDVIDGDVVLRDTVTNQVSRLPNEILSNEPENDTRCQAYGARNRATIEDPLSLTAGRFYEVEIVNKNGLFYENAEDVPPDDETARANGRTIHVCWSPTDSGRPADTITDCTRVRPVQAACPLDGPTCDATTGGVWGGATGQQPRSLAFCEQAGINCGETPREFSSREVQSSWRQYIYVETAPPVKRITTSLQNVTCHNETGWDWTGSDELAVSLTGVVGAAMPPGQPQVSVSSDAFQHSYDSGDNHKQIRQPLTSIDVSEAGDPFTGQAGYLLVLLEDDDAFWSTLAGIAIITGAIFAAVYLWPILSNPVAAAGLAAGLSAAWAMIADKAGGDDTLGVDSLSASIGDVTARGAMSHDTIYSSLAPLPSFDAVTPQYRGAYEVSVHPAVDGFGRQLNSEVTGLECTASSDCATGESCAIGLCVPQGWADLEPAVGSNPPGFLERREFVNGDSWRYDIYLGWHVTSSP